ncbi:hypothetical protein S7335_171 [Synechococcus sp. PCC 7335]|uniref:substrate-binding domain-containing protein n=1 Tax=Synechococcus sp. (strain ATCC 29403 / PCC 7335) TaxID=91464 RepID=UPI00017ECB69|nr:substrate-binding domain-containing protein [Synechococcus sp. PCC 7335]EDX82993.1 hypothetical protein S7335_171 [Synechococcus sp. PCC 7335]
MSKLKRLFQIGPSAKIFSATIFGAMASWTLSGCQPSPSTDTVPTRSEAAQSRPPLLTAQIDTPTALSTTSVREDNILPAVAPLGVRGDLIIAGSDAMAPLVEAVAERFIDEGFSGDLTVERISFEEGFSVFCKEGKADIVIVSRAIGASERQDCAAINRRPVALAVGSDALAIVVGTDNDFLTVITQAELAQILTAQFWSDVRPEWPERTIRRTLPDPDSSALQLFVNKVFDGDLEPLLKSSNSDFFSEDEDFLAQSLAVDPDAIAFISYTYYETNRDQLRLVSINGNSPTRGDYPFIQTLFLYVDANTLRSSSPVSIFLNFFLTHVNEQMSPLGYFSLPQKQLDETKKAFLSLLDGTTK